MNERVQGAFQRHGFWLSPTAGARGERATIRLPDIQVDGSHAKLRRRVLERRIPAAGLRRILSRAIVCRSLPTLHSLSLENAS